MVIKPDSKRVIATELPMLEMSWLSEGGCLRAVWVERQPGSRDVAMF